jgi:serine/threonine protein kinase
MLTKAQDDELVMSLVELAMARPPEEREDFIRSACDGDFDLVAQVRNYVHWEETMGRFLLDPIYSLNAFARADGPTETLTFLLDPIHSRTALEHRFEPGERLLNRFRILRLVAEGGMGVVYEARDEKLDRRIAIKCAKTGYDKRLPPEVRHAREISHPNVCKIFEIHTASTARGEVDFFTMEFLEGETLADRLHRGPLPPSEARSIARQISAGLAEAHRYGVVHGDLKSRNVIISTDARNATVRAVITDFGLAHGSAANAPGGILQSAQAGGTPDYMAPELWKGAQPTCASDVYALGVILHELESGGHRPFGREAPPEERRAGKPLPLHNKWDPIWIRCLDPDPARRFQDATEVAEALAPPRPLPWLLMAAAVVLAISVGVVTYRVVTGPKESWRLAMLPIESSSAETASLAGSLSRNTAIQLGRLRGGSAARLAFIPPDKASASPGKTHVLHATLTKQDGKLALHAVLTDARSGADLKDWNAEYAPGEMTRYAPVALAGMVTGTLKLPPLSVATVNSAAARDYWAGVWYTRQNSTLDAALRTLNQAVAEDPDSPLTLAALAEAQWFEYWLTKDQIWLTRARDTVWQAEARNPDVAAAHRVEGYLHYNEGFYEQAVPEFERAIKLQADNAMAHIYLAKTYEDNGGQLDLAQSEFERATEAQSDYFRTWQNLGAFNLKHGHFSEAAKYHKKAVDLAPGEPNLHWNLAVAYMDSGRFDDARQEIAGQEGAAALTTFGTTLMYEGMYQAAIPYLERALNIKSPPGGIRRYTALMYLGIAYRHLNMPDKAMQMNVLGLKMADAEMAGKGNARDGALEAFQGYFSAALGDPRARTQIQQALGLMPKDSDARWGAVLAYEELYRLSRDRAFRDKSLEVLRGDTPEQVADIGRWSDLDDLRRDPHYQELVPTR